MKQYISSEEIFISYDARSKKKFSQQLAAHIVAKFGHRTTFSSAQVKDIISEGYDWMAVQTISLVTKSKDANFIYSLFAYHEASILLYKRVLAQEDIEQTIAIDPYTLALNRRVLRLLLEQTCDVDYTFISAANQTMLQEIDGVIEDLLYLGSELIGFGQYLAEIRIVPGTLLAGINSQGELIISRTPETQALFDALNNIIQEDFKLGIFDVNGVQDMKDTLLRCMKIDYDFAGAQIVQIKKHHQPAAWQFQTIEPGILAANLVSNGVSTTDAQNFYDGLTLGRHNKLPLKESVYKVNSMERYFFRPILLMMQNGKERQLIGIEKWSETIVVLVTNGFQWNKSSEEWKRNVCFTKYLEQKGTDHDKLLEDEVEKVLIPLKMPFQRNIKSFNNDKRSERVDILGIGEMDFVWLDLTRNKLVVADCKYSRARYDMISFSADYTNFTTAYETKINNKLNWLRSNIELVCDHLIRINPSLAVNTNTLSVEAIFIVNTPTFYMFCGGVKTTCFFRLEEFIINDYTPPELTLSVKTRKGYTVRIQQYPYFA